MDNAIRVTDVADGQTEVRIYSRDNNEYKQVIHINPYGSIGIALSSDPQASLHVGSEARFDGGIRISGRRVISWDSSAHTYYDVNRLVTVAPETHFLFSDKFELRHGVQNRNTLKLRVQDDGTYIHESFINRLSERKTRIISIQYVWNDTDQCGRLFLKRGDVDALIGQYSQLNLILPLYFKYKDDIYAVYPLYSDGKCEFWKYVGKREPWDRELPWHSGFNNAWQKITAPGWNPQTPVAARAGLLPEKIEFQVDELIDDNNMLQVTDKFEEPLLTIRSSNYGMIGMFNSNPEYPLHVTNYRGYPEWMGCFQNYNTNILLSHRFGHGMLIDRLTDNDPNVTVFECKNQNHKHLLVRGDGITTIGYERDKIPYPNHMRLQVDGDTWTSGWALISNVKIGTISTQDAYFTHCNMYQRNNYALKQESDGITSVNTPNHKSIKFCVNNIEYMRMDSRPNDTDTGNVGIRCLCPTAALQVTPRLGIYPESNGIYIYNSNQDPNDRFYHAILGIHTARDKPYIALKCDHTNNAWAIGMDSEDQGKLKIQSAWTLDGNVPRFTMDSNGFTTFMNREVADTPDTFAFKIQRRDSNNEHSVHMYVRNDGRIAIRHSNPLTNLDVKGKALIDDRQSKGLPVVGDVGGGGDRVIIQKGTLTSFPISIGVDTGDVLWNSVPNLGSFKWYHNGSQNPVMHLRCNQLDLRAQMFAYVDDIGNGPRPTMDNSGARIILRRNATSLQYPTAIGYIDSNFERVPESNYSVYQHNMMWFGVPRRGTFTWYNNNSNFMTLDSCNVLQVTHDNTGFDPIKGMIKCGRLQTYGYISTSNNYIDTERAYIRTSQLRFAQVLYDIPKTGIDLKDFFVGGEGTRISLHDTVTGDYQFAFGMDSNAMWSSMPLSNMGKRTFFKWYVGGVEEMTLTNDELDMCSNNIEMGHGRLKFSACNMSPPTTDGEINHTASMNTVGGTRIVYAPSSNTISHYPFATGMEDDALWHSVPMSNNHRWYVDGVRQMNLDSNQLDMCSNNIEMGAGRVMFSGCNINGPLTDSQLYDPNNDNTIKLWNIEQTPITIGTFKGHTDTLFSAFFSLDDQLITSSKDNTVKIWQINNVNDKTVLKFAASLLGHTKYVTNITHIALNANDKYIATTSADNTVKLWQVDRVNEQVTALCVATIEGHTGTVTSVAYSPLGNDSVQLATASDDGTVKLWRVSKANGDITATLITTLEGHTAGVTCVAYSPLSAHDVNSKQLATASADNTVKLWQVTEEHGIVTSKRCIITLNEHTGTVTNLAYSPDSRRIVTTSADNTVKLWNMEDYTCTTTLNEHTSAVTCVVYKTNTVFATCSYDKTAKLWQVDTANGITNVTCIDTLRGHTTGITNVAFSPDGKHLATTSVRQTDGTRVIYQPSRNTTTKYPWAVGVEDDALWHSVPMSNNHRWYINGVPQLNLDSNQLNTCSNNIEMGFGKVKFSGCNLSEPRRTSQLDDSNQKLTDGTCIVYRPSSNVTEQYPWASGVGESNLWHSVPLSNNHAWYINGKLEMNLDACNLNVCSNNIEMGNGWVMWNGCDSNRPSAATPGGGKVILRSRDGGNYSTAIGEADAQMWFGVPRDHSFRYYVQGVNILRVQRPNISNEHDDDFWNIASGAVVFGTTNTSVESYRGEGVKVLLGSNMALGMNTNYMWWYSGCQNYFTWNIGDRRMLSLYYNLTNNATGVNNENKFSISLPYIMSSTSKISASFDPLVMTGHHMQTNGVISSTMTKHLYCDAIYTKDNGFINTGAVHIGGWIDASINSTIEGNAGVSLMKTTDNKYAVFSRDLVVSHGDVIAKNLLYSSNNAVVEKELRVNKDLMCSNVKAIGTNIVLHNTVQTANNNQSLNNFKEFTGCNLKINDIYQFTSPTNINLRDITVFHTTLRNPNSTIVLNPSAQEIKTSILVVPFSSGREIRFNNTIGSIPILYSSERIVTPRYIVGSSTSGTLAITPGAANDRVEVSPKLYSPVVNTPQVECTNINCTETGTFHNLSATSQATVGPSITLSAGGGSISCGTLTSGTITSTGNISASGTITSTGALSSSSFNTGSVTCGYVTCNGINSTSTVSCTGLTSSGDVVASSDKRLKTGICDIKDALAKITRLNGKTYQLKAAPEQGCKMGLIAQEVEPVVPEVVHKDTDGYYSLAYMNLVALLIEGVKELKQEIDAIKMKPIGA